MTTITHTPDGPRFDGMTPAELAAATDRMAARLADRGFSAASYGLMNAAAAALRHMSEWQPIETAILDGRSYEVWWNDSFVIGYWFVNEKSGNPGSWIPDAIRPFSGQPTHYRNRPLGPGAALVAAVKEAIGDE